MDMCRWAFLHSADAIRKQEFSESLPNASVQDLGVILMGAGYEVNFNILAAYFIWWDCCLVDIYVFTFIFASAKFIVHARL